MTDEIKLLYRPKEFDDWGMIRTETGSLFAVVRRPVSDQEADFHRETQRDPFQEMAERLISTYDKQSLNEKLREAEQRANDAERLLAEVEKRFPNWEQYRDLLDCIDVTLDSKG